MKYICKDCGKVFDGDEIERRYESRGEFWGVPCSEEIAVCPRCGGDFNEAKQCKICGEWIDDDDWDICEDCLKKHKTIDNCIEIGEEIEMDISINGFLSFIYSKEDIEKVLVEHLKKDAEKAKEYVDRFCYDDMSYFVDRVLEKCGKEQ